MKKALFFLIFLGFIAFPLLSKPKKAPKRLEWVDNLDYGPFIATCLSENQEDTDPILKGLVVSIGEGRSHQIAYDTALLQMTGAWKGKVFLQGTPWNGTHGSNPTVEGETIFWSKKQPGWSYKGSSEDTRAVPYGTLAKEQGRYKGIYRNGDKVVLHFNIEGQDVYESPELIEGSVIARHFYIPNTGKGLTLLLTDIDEKVGVSKNEISKTLNLGNNGGLDFISEGLGRKLVKLPAGKKDYRISFYFSSNDASLSLNKKTPHLEDHFKGGPAHWPKTVTLKGKVSDEKDAYVVDEIPIPETNPYNVVFRSGGFDFFSDGKSAAFCTWNGDVWICSGIDDDLQNLTWRRYASGLFETIGVKIVDDVVYVSGKDQITRLYDLNGDGEADQYECFNNDIMITQNFHEFTFGLQTDKAGNFYVAKAGPVKRGGRGFEATHSNHGVVFKVSKDGQSSEVYASGLRAPGGLGIGPNGEVTTGENEGTYVPACKINWVTKGSFHGVIHPGNGKTEEEGYDLPLCWLPMWADNSGGGQVWVPDDRWGPFKGELFHLSYGQSTLFKVMKERVDGQIQGGVSRIPLSLVSSAMRARFNKRDGQLYLLGFQGWQTNAAKLCGFQRVRYTGNDLFIPSDLETTSTGVKFTFTEKIDPETALNPGSYKVSRFNYLYCSQYGSGTFSLSASEEVIQRGRESESKRFMSVKDLVFVKSVSLMDDGYSIHLELDDMQKANQIEYEFKLKSAKGKSYSDRVYQTVHHVPETTISKAAIVASKTFKEKKIDWSEYNQGLVTTYTQNEKVVDRSVVRTVGNRLTKNELPALGMAQEPYILEYEGYIHIKEVGSFQLLLDDPSRMLPDIQIGATTIRYITPSYRPKPNQLLPVMSLPLGLHKFKISKLSMTPEKDYAFKLKWQWEGKALEPISPELFFHKPTPELKESLALRKGRELVGSKQCTACHTTDLENNKGMPELWERAPNLNNVGSRLNESWMQEWLLSPKALRHSANMPSLFKGDKQAAANVAAYLSTLGEKSGHLGLGSDKIKNGGALFNDLGCIACHSSPNKLKQVEGRLSLGMISSKYQPKALVDFLLKPEANHKDTRMPNFALSRKEAESLAVFLMAESSKVQTIQGGLKGQPAEGKKLVSKMGCANCHQLDQTSKVNAPKLASLGGSSANCKQVDYTLSKDETDSIKLALGNVKSFNQHIKTESAQRAIERLNCAACHTRDNASDLWSKFANETSQWKVEHAHRGHLAQDRPSLTHAGEKLNADYMKKLLKGELPYNARPWLLAKMPSFPSRADRIVSGVTAQHGMRMAKQKVKSSPEGVKTGHQLVGTQGFACIVCHGVSKDKPLAAFEVEGVNLSYVADRLTPSYYERWMLDPTRIDPRTKMPRYSTDNAKTSLNHIHGGDAREQFEAIWQYLQKGLNMKKPVGIP